jgi:hypothetical protein
VSVDGLTLTLALLPVPTSLVVNSNAPNHRGGDGVIWVAEDGGGTDGFERPWAIALFAGKTTSKATIRAKFTRDRPTLPDRAAKEY